MTISSGTKLGSYEIVSRIGAGGMGEVWRAKDAKIGRDVAIKVLPASLVADADRLQRFEQEARAAGTLNHPNLVTIYELGTHDGAPFIAMELLEGETLRDRLDRGAIPPRKSIEYAVQIANGLAAAHEKGVVHRDLKPENIFVMPDGRIKILDFGLAKLTAPADVPEDQTAKRGTAPGTVMGTAGYMSPEQVLALDIDHRSDIFSFGAILYEMLSGHRAFKRDSSVETMNAILKEDPPELSITGAHVSPAIDRIIRRCLEKNAAARFQNARDLSFALDGLSGTSASQALAGTAATRSPRRSILIASAGAALLGLMTALFFFGRWSRPEAAQPTMRQLTFGNGTVRSARFAPDGQTIVYGAAWDGRPLKLFQRRLDGSESVPLEFPDGDVLSVSSKGELAISLGRKFRNWLTSGTLAKAPLLGSSYRKVLDGVSWSDWHPSGDGLLIVRRANNEDRLEYPIGKILYRTTGYISYPRFSAAGDRIAFLDHPAYGDNRGNVSVITLAGKKSDLVLDWSGLEGLAWSAKANEIWFSGAQTNGSWAIYAIGIGGGTPRAVWRTPSNLILHDVDRHGRALVASATLTSIVRGMGRGEQHDRDLSLGWSAARDVSPDGKNAAVVVYGGDASLYYDLYVDSLAGGPATRLGEGEPIQFSSDGKWVLAMILSAPPRIVLYGTESESSKTINVAGLDVSACALFPDSQRILLLVPNGARIDSYVQDIASGARTRLPLQHQGAGNPLISPDGLKIMFIGRAIKSSIYTIAGEHVRDVEAPNYALAWTSDSKGVFVYSPAELPIKVQKLDLATGTVTPWKEIAMPDLAGASNAPDLVMNQAGDAYAYSVFRMMTDLFIVDGLR
ncbi:MAG: eukaryotic-like serine/threonine-protein kinase [Thermoanaerobaculia bacterium]|jgi:Tol biopolymer transport system component|nr:eukaryotic-like serine/threonine-protein kinase [Thermoanaerobaculia bacterium]